MANSLNRHITNVVDTPVTEKIRGKKMVKNNTGGFVFEVTDKTRLERFLILGTDGGTFYTGEREYTRENTNFLIDLISKDADSENMVAKVTMDVSKNNRAKKTSPAIFTTAALFQFGENKEQAREVFNTVVRTSTHLFEFIGYLKILGGMGRAKRLAIASWYENKTDDALAYQMVKYRQRNGFTHRDALRISHAKPGEANALFALGKDVKNREDAPVILKGFYEAQAVTSESDAIKVLTEYKNLPWETLPTEQHKSAKVWKTLFENGALKGTALVRQNTRMARLGMFDNTAFTNAVAARIREDVATAGIHPVQYLLALVTHTDGQMDRRGTSYWGSATRKKDWVTNQTIAAALQEAFYASFGNLETSDARVMFATDVSASMSAPAMGLDLSAAQVSGAMAMTLSRQFPNSIIRGFSSKGGYYGRGGTCLTDLGISARTALEDAMKKVQMSNFGSTDASLPFTVAQSEGIELDAVVVITDNEVNQGKHPSQALRAYRKATGLNTRLVVAGVSVTDFSIADPNDAGSLDVVGFDSAAPALITDFIAGRL